MSGKVKISRTVYDIVGQKDDEKYIFYTIQKGKTQKSLVFSKIRQKYDLWSCRNGLNSVGMPKPCEPTFLEEDQIEEKPAPRRKSTTKTPQIKKDLKAAFPGVKFSVRYRCPYGYTVQWENGIEQGAGVQAVKAITDKYHTLKDISHDWDPIFSGDSVNLEHTLTDPAWKELVIKTVADQWSDEYYFDQAWDRFTCDGGNTINRCYRINEMYQKFLHNGFETEEKEIVNEPVEEITKEEPVIEAAVEEVVIEETEEKELNWYEQKQQDRKDYYLGKAGRFDDESDRLYDESKQITKHIPFGQPILLGHHSERRHRKDLDKSWNKMGQSVEASRKAEHYRDKAAAVGKGGISSDDPDAIAKLTKKVEDAKACQEQMKAANKLVRKGDRDGLSAMGYRDDVIDQLLTEDFAGRIGFPDYELTNNLANIKRMEKRIAELQRKDEEFSYKEIDLDYVKIVHNTEINRVQLVFDGKPEKEIRDVVKQNGFRWSRYNMAWQRQLNNTGVWQAQRVAELIKDL